MIVANIVLVDSAKSQSHKETLRNSLEKRLW